MKTKNSIACSLLLVCAAFCGTTRASINYTNNTDQVVQVRVVVHGITTVENFTSTFTTESFHKEIITHWLDYPDQWQTTTDIEEGYDGVVEDWSDFSYSGYDEWRTYTLQPGDYLILDDSSSGTYSEPVWNYEGHDTFDHTTDGENWGERWTEINLWEYWNRQTTTYNYHQEETTYAIEWVN